MSLNIQEMTKNICTNKLIALVGLGLHKSTGGPAKTIGNFSNALNAEVVAFACEDTYNKEKFFNNNTVGALFPKHGIRGLYNWPKSKNLNRANYLAEKIAIFSCHILYRYHVHWIMKQVKINPRPYWIVPHGCLDPYTYKTRKWMKWLWMFFVGRKFIQNRFRYP